jgi:hypothetical protein
MEKKFVKLLETAMSRTLRGGFLVGDYVELVKNYKTHQEYKALHDDIKAKIDDLTKSDLHMRVINVNDIPALRYPGNTDAMNGVVSVTIAQDQGGGRYFEAIIVAPCLLKKLEHYPNYPKFPDSFNYNAKITHKPEKVVDVDGGIDKGTYTLASKNTKISTKK